MRFSTEGEAVGKEGSHLQLIHLLFFQCVKLAKKIYDEFLASNASHQVNVDSSVYKTVQEGLSAARADLFSQAQRDVSNCSPQSMLKVESHVVLEICMAWDVCGFFRLKLLVLFLLLHPFLFCVLGDLSLNSLKNCIATSVYGVDAWHVTAVWFYNCFFT